MLVHAPPTDSKLLPIFSSMGLHVYSSHLSYIAIAIIALVHGSDQDRQVHYSVSLYIISSSSILAVQLWGIVIVNQIAHIWK